jgi:hypothetical protein
VAKFRHFKTTVSNKNYIFDGVGKLNLGNVCCHSVQKLLTSLIETFTEIYRFTNLKVLFYVDLNVVHQSKVTLTVTEIKVLNRISTVWVRN